MYNLPDDSGDYLSPILQRNPNYREFFEEYFPKKILFTHLFRFLYKPVANVQKDVDKLFLEFEKYKYVIGMHVRKTKFKTMDENFPYQDFCDLAKSLAVNKGFKTDEILMYIGSDRPHVSLFA